MLTKQAMSKNRCVLATPGSMAKMTYGVWKFISRTKGVSMKQEFRMKDKTYPVWLNHKGYACVSVEEGGTEKAYLLHRLVWEQENGMVPPGHELHHIDGNKANWSLDNLIAL